MLVLWLAFVLSSFPVALLHPASLLVGAGDISPALSFSSMFGVGHLHELRSGISLKGGGTWSTVMFVYSTNITFEHSVLGYACLCRVFVA